MADELNIGKEIIAEFLRAKGFDISPKPTEQLSQEMYDLVMDKFEKEHRQIEKQRKKVDAYHEKRVRPKDEAATAKKGKGKEATDDSTSTEESPEEVTPVAATEAPELPVQPLQPEPPAPIEVRFRPNEFSFFMKDTDGVEKKVILHQPKPQDFEMSEQIVVTGKLENDVFNASEILMKCPSKYKDEEIAIKSQENQQ